MISEESLPGGSFFVCSRISAILVPPDLNTFCIASAIYARSTPAKLAVGSTTPSLRRRTPDADIRHYYSVIYAMLY